MASNDVVVYEDLKIANMVKNHHLAKSISDASWYQFTQWLDYYGKIWDKAVVAVSPNYTSQDCSNCGHRTKKSLSRRTHSCSVCGFEICRDTNAAINILKKGMKVLGIEWQNNSTQGHWESAEQSGKHGEKTANTIEGQPNIALRFSVNHELESPTVHGGEYVNRLCLAVWANLTCFSAINISGNRHPA